MRLPVASFVLLRALVLSLSLAGCVNHECPPGSVAFGKRCVAEDGGGPADAGVDARPAVDLGELESDASLGDLGAPSCDEAELAHGESYFYVLNVVQFAPHEIGEPPFQSRGFDLDGNDTIDCGTVRAGVDTEFGGVAPDSGSGIDNALGEPLGGLVNDALQRRVDEASQLMLVEVRGVDDLANDACVSVAIFAGELPAATPTPLLDVTGRLAADQTFDVSADSFVDGVAGTIPRVLFGSTTIVDGRVEAAVADVPVTAPLLASGLPLLVRGARLRFDITAGRLSTGVLGGAVVAQEAIDAAEADPTLVMYVDLLRDTFLSLRDLDADGSPASCEADSLTVGLAGVAAVRGVTRAATPP